MIVTSVARDSIYLTWRTTLGNTWHFVVNGDRVMINTRSSCGMFQLCELPRDWRDQFGVDCVRDAILAELRARALLGTTKGAAAESIAHEGVRMSWYSVRARLLPDCLEPVARAYAGPDGRVLPSDTMVPPGMDVAMLAATA
jgi:hypothetical protein